jgi:hypothetical protein
MELSSQNASTDMFIEVLSNLLALNQADAGSNYTTPEVRTYLQNLFGSRLSMMKTINRIYTFSNIYSNCYFLVTSVSSQTSSANAMTIISAQSMIGDCDWN